MVKKIAVFGSFGTGNIGDEAVWIAIKDFFSKKDHKYKFNFEIFQWSHHYLSSPYHYHEFYFFNEKTYKYFNNNFDALIIAGGGIIGKRWGAITIPKFKELINNLRVPIFTVSIGAEKGDYNDEDISKIKLLKEKSEIFTVRDNYSKNILSELGFPDIEITDDIVYYLTNFLNYSNHPFNHKAIATVHSSLLDDNFVNFWKNLKNKIGFKISYIPFSHDPNDIMGSQLINGSMHFNTYHVQEMLYLMSEVDFVIAGKLHACVLAALQNKPFFAINYHPKVKEFCDKINYPYYYPKHNDLKINRVNYGHDLNEYDVDELAEQINAHHNNPVIPRIVFSGENVLEKIWDSIKNRGMKKWEM